MLRRFAQGCLALLAALAAAPAAAVNTFLIEPSISYFASRNHLAYCDPNSCASRYPIYRFSTPLAACENRIYNELVTYSGFLLYDAHVDGPLRIPFTDTLFRDEPGFMCYGYFDIPAYPGVPARPRQRFDASAVLVEGVCPNGTVPVRVSATQARCRATCPDHQTWHPASNSCKTVFQLPLASAPPFCPADPGDGNPIHPLRGIKREAVDLRLRVGELALGLTYDSTAHAPRQYVGATPAANAPADDAVLGASWSTNLHRRLVAAPAYSLNSVTPGAMLAARGAGVVVTFQREAGGQYSADPSRSDRLVALADGRHRYYDVAAGVMEDYDAAGRLVTMSWPGGARVDLVYSDLSTPVAVAPGAGHLIRAIDHRGRSVSLSYTSQGSPAAVRLKSIAADGTLPTVLDHDPAGRLRSITWPDGTRRSFVYENSALPWALTGVVDESSARLSTFGYDQDGRAVSTERAGGVQRYAVSYAAPPQIRVTETLDPGMNAVFRVSEWVPPEGTAVIGPNGSTGTLAASSIGGRTYLGARSQPAGSGCAPSTRALTFDTVGNLTSEDDFNGHRRGTAPVPGRRLEATRVEGLPAGQACAGVLAANAALPANSRKISTQWHPSWALRTRVAEPGRITTYVYNGQPDPFAGNTPAACAPTAAPLPDGTPIAVLCKQVEQATSDPDGSAGFAAAVDGSVAVRGQTWTYNADGQVLTHDGPRTDVTDVTLYEYHATTSFTGTDPNAVGVTRGDLKQVTRPNGSSVLYKLYDKLGQVLETEDANGVVSLSTYDTRQRLTSVTVAGRRTEYEYGPTGLLRQITQPDGSWVRYGHDDAQRLVQVSDNLGNSVTYTLDNTGNRTDEQYKDPSGLLRRHLARSIDALGRVQQLTGRE